MSKVILITGTSSGFGRTIAEKLHSEGYTVIGTSRNPEKLHSDYLTIKLDINDYLGSKSEVDQIINKFGKIDVLINNAGINITGPTEIIKMHDVKRVFDTNFFSHLNLIQKVLPHMRSKKMGLIINITSIAGYLGLPFWSAYCASKASFGVLAESLNIELKNHNIDSCYSDLVKEAILAIIETPLGKNFKNKSLIDIPESNIVKEMKYEIPISYKGKIIKSNDIAECFALDEKYDFSNEYISKIMGLDIYSRGFHSGYIDCVLSDCSNKENSKWCKCS